MNDEIRFVCFDLKSTDISFANRDKRVINRISEGFGGDWNRARAWANKANDKLKQAQIAGLEPKALFDDE